MSFCQQLHTEPGMGHIIQRMPRALSRIFVAIAAALCAWLVAIPAWATQAPQCDHRGAITFAPPPQLQPPEQSLDVEDDLTCLERMLLDSGVQQGNSPVPSPTATEPVSLPASAAVAAASPERNLAENAPSVVPNAGVKTRLERPPRS